MRSFHARQEGLTLPELMVAIFLLAVVSVVFLPTLVSGMRATEQITNAARSNDSARLAVQRIDREMRAAQQICTPLPGDPPGDTLSFITRAYTASTTATGTRNVVYQLNGTVLEKSLDDGATWSPVIEGVLNATKVDEDYNLSRTPSRAPGTAGVPLFTNEQANGEPSFGKVITVRIWVDDDPTDDIGEILLTTELSGRNIWVPNGPGC
ncbi:MAG TPA: prepilin-type N-terminal cleavage/methylation domain-containing protein [Acidimicrobiia bacterium]|nr:prepilin-type N-terminal cleavage/methylation domain-containing protein [Acidimicrobiia bacterium]